LTANCSNMHNIL